MSTTKFFGLMTSFVGLNVSFCGVENGGNTIELYSCLVGLTAAISLVCHFMFDLDCSPIGTLLEEANKIHVDVT